MSKTIADMGKNSIRNLFNVIDLEGNDTPEAGIDRTKSEKVDSRLSHSRRYL